MTRYHIKKDGTPGQCHAQPGHCPLGGEGEHYPSMEAAQAAADIKNMENFSKSDIINKSDIKTDNDKYAVDVLSHINNRDQLATEVKFSTSKWSYILDHSPAYQQERVTYDAAISNQLTNIAIRKGLISNSDKIVTTQAAMDGLGFHDGKFTTLEKEQERADNLLDNSTGEPVTLNFSNMSDMNSKIANKLENAHTGQATSGIYIVYADGSTSQVDDSSALALTNIAATDLKENTSRVDIDKALNKINPKSNRKHYQVKGSGKIKINRAMNKLGKKAKYRVKRSAKKLARAPIKITTKVAKKAVRKAISSKLGYQQMYQLTGYFSPNYTPH